jgi:hypothetical protein
MTAVDSVSEAQAHVIWRVVTNARAGRFDALAVHAELVAAGYTLAEVEVLVEKMVERLAATDL